MGGMRELLPGPCSLHVRRGDRSRCLVCKSTWAKPGRGVSCLSRAPGMSVCLGTKRKCLWSIWAGRGQGAVYL